MKKFLPFLLFAATLHAQTTPVSGTIQAVNGQPAGQGSFVEFSLVNCGNTQPTVKGVAVILNAPVDFYLDANGNLQSKDGTPAVLYGNDQISCGSIGNTSRYSVQQYPNGQPAGPAKIYFIQSGVAFNLNTAQPVFVMPPLKYPNPTKCPAGQTQTGLNNDLSVVCSNLPSGASNAVVINPGGTQTVVQPPGTTLSVQGAFCASSTNGAFVVGCGSNIDVQTTIANAGVNGRVYIPAGVYSSTTPFHFLNGQTVDCAVGSAAAGVGAIANGAVLQLAPGAGANYVVQAASLSSEVIGLTMNNCILDASKDTSALGGLDFSSFNHMNANGVKVFLPAMGAMACFNGNAATAGTFWNTFTGAQCTTPGGNAFGNSHVAVRLTNQANSNTFIGLNSQTIDTFLSISNSTANTFDGGGTDSWGTNCVHLLSGSSSNKISGIRCETAKASTVGKINPTTLLFDAGAFNNKVDTVFQGGPYIANVSPVGGAGALANNWSFADTADEYHSQIVSNVGAIMGVGVNKAPTIFPLNTKGGMDVNGPIQTNNAILSLNPGAYADYMTPAPPVGNITNLVVSPGGGGSTATFTDSAASTYAVGETIAVSITGTGSSYSSNYVVSSIGSGTWTANTGSAAINSAVTGTSAITSNPVTSLSISSGVITFTQANNWPNGTVLFVSIPIGPYSFLTGKYTVISSTSSNWTANAPLTSTSQIDVINATSTANFNSSGILFPIGPSIQVTLTGSFAGYSGTYVSTGTGIVGSSAFWTAPCFNCTDTGGVQSTSGTAQLFTLASTTLVGANAIPYPSEFLSCDTGNNCSVNPPTSGTRFNNNFTSLVTNNIVPKTNGAALIGFDPIANTTAPFGNIFVGPSSEHTLSFAGLGALTGNRFINVVDNNSMVAVVGLNVPGDPNTAVSYIGGPGDSTPNMQHFTAIPRVLVTGSVSPSSVAGGQCADQSLVLTGATATTVYGSVTPPSALGNLSVSAHTGGSNAVTFHFCNVSGSSVTPPTGVYTVMGLN